VPDTGQEFRFRISSPYGTEVLQVLATLTPAKELERLVNKTGQAAPVSQESLNELHERLKNDLSSWTEHRMPIRTAAKSDESPARKPARVGLFVGREQVPGQRGQGRRQQRPLPSGRGADGQGDGPSAGSSIRSAPRRSSRAGHARQHRSRDHPLVAQRHAARHTVFIFYGGHGGLIKNLDGTKPDGKDGVLTTYNNAFQGKKLSEDDWDAEARKNWISDNTLARWLQELPGRQIALLIRVVTRVR